MEKKLVMGGVLTLCLALTGATSWAQGEDPAISTARVSELDTMVVTADRHAEPLREVSQSMVVIGEAEIQNSSATDPGDLLKKYGLQITQRDGAAYGQDTITIRGFSSSYHGNDINSNVLVLIDGRRAVGDSLGTMGLDNIERIEIIRGPGAMQYGSSAMGGVVNIITKRGGESPNLRLEAGSGTWSREKYSAFGSGRLGRLDAALALSYEDSGDYKDGAGVKYKHSGRDDKWGYMATFGWNFNEYHRLGFSLQGSKLDNAGRGLLEGSGTSTAPYYYRFIDKEVTSLDVVYEGGSEAGDKSWLARYYQGTSKYDMNRLYLDPAPAGWTEVPNSSSETDFQGAQAQLSWNFSRLELTGGLDWLDYDMDQRQLPSGRGRANSKNNRSMNLGDYENVGAFLLGKAYFLEDRNLILDGGVRYDQYKVRMNNTAWQGSPQVIKNSRVDKDFDKVLPSVGLVYNPTDFLKLRTNYAMAYKVPTPRELAGNYTMMQLFVGNPNLDPEESRTWEIGFDLDYSNLILSGTYFYTKYKNYMAYGPADEVGIPGGLSTERAYFNIAGDSTISGFELGLKYNFGQQFGWGADLTPYLNWTHISRYEAEDGRRLPYIAEDSLGFGTEIAYEPFGLAINIDGTYYGSQGVTSFLSQTSDPRWTGGATVWDLSVVKRLWDTGGHGDLSLKVAAKNIFDKEYGFEEDFAMPGSSVYIGLIYDYK